MSAQEILIIFLESSIYEFHHFSCRRLQADKNCEQILEGAVYSAQELIRNHLAANLMLSKRAAFLV